MFEIMWQQHHADICRFICARVAAVEDAEDILQDVFTRAYSNMDQLNDPEKSRGWLYSIARHAIIDHYRARREVVPLEQVAYQLNDDTQQAEDPLGAAERLAACVRRIVQDMPEKYRQALTVAELDDVPQTELADRLKLSYSGAKSRVQRGREQLRARLLAECRPQLEAHPELTLTPHRCCKF